VKYTKNDWRNRNIIYPKNGKQWLSIPIAAQATRLAIDEVLITDKHWQTQHFKSLYYAYKKAPHFAQLEALMIDYLQEKAWTHLSTLNQYLIRYISQKLGCNIQFYNARSFPLEGLDRVERLLVILEQLKADTYISGQAARQYLDGQERLFEAKGIDLVYKTYPNYPQYKQLATPFEQGVSIVDMIAHLEWSEIPAYIWL
jgi:hypothetical protein